MKNNIKKVIWIVIGIIIGTSTVVTAATIFNSKDITYNSDKTTKTNVKDSLDELYSKVGKCPDGMYCYETPKILSKTVDVGDYISMTPTSTSYMPDTAKTGVDSYPSTTSNLQKEFNPSELNEWIVIRKNSDGTIDAVSRYVSTPNLIIYGDIGYNNYVGVLNVVAAQYTNSKYVIKTRHVGYDSDSGGEEFCTASDPKKCVTDTGYLTDYNLLLELGIIKGYLHGNSKPMFYWLASRKYYSLGGLWVYDIAGEALDRGWKGGELLGYSIQRQDNTTYEISSAHIRPVVTFKSDVSISGGEGTSESPYTLS